jgi:hypothetical protein
METAASPSATAGARPFWESAAIVAVSFCVLALVAFWGPAFRTGYPDFLSFYAGAKLAGTPYLYSVEHVYEIQKRIGNPAQVSPFTRPPAYAVLLWPLGQLPYATAERVWQGLNLCAFAGFFWLWAPRDIMAPICCLFFPIWISFVVGQDTPLLLLIIAFGASLLRGNRSFAAGLVFSLCLIKFHLFILLALVVLAKRLWRFASGVLTGALGLAAVSFAVAGSNWPVQYVAVLRANEQGQNSYRNMPNLNGLFHSVPHSAIWLALATLVVAYATWRVARRSGTDEAIGVALWGGLLTGLHGFIYDCGLLLPLLTRPPGRIGLQRTIVLVAALQMSTVALGQPSISWLGQSALLLLFVGVALIVHFGPDKAAVGPASG